MATRQTFTGRYTPAGTSTEYISPTLLTRGSTAESAIKQPWLTNARARALKVIVPTAPGSGKSRAFTFRVNGADTALTVTIADTAISAYLEASVTIADGDLIAVSHVTAGSPATVAAIIALVIDHDGDGVTCYGGTNGGEVITTNTTYHSQIFNGGWGPVGSISRTNVSPTTTTLTRITIELDAAPGVGHTLTFDLLLNAAAQSIGLSIADAATSGSVSLSIPISVNDALVMRCIRDLGTSTINVKAAYRFSGTDGETIVAAPDGLDLHAGTTYYYTPNQSQNESTTESNVIVYGAGTRIRLRKLTASTQRAFVISTGPATFAVRKNGATVMSVTAPAADWLTGTPTYATPDTTSDIPFETTDSMTVSVRIDIGTSWVATWGFVQYQLTVPDLGEGTLDTELETDAGVIGPHAWVEWPRAVP